MELGVNRSANPAGDLEPTKSEALAGSHPSDALVPFAKNSLAGQIAAGQILIEGEGDEGVYPRVVIPHRLAQALEGGAELSGLLLKLSEAGTLLLHHRRGCPVHEVSVAQLTPAASQLSVHFFE